MQGKLRIASCLGIVAGSAAGATSAPTAQGYPDGRPIAALRMEAADAGPVLRHGDGPARCDTLGAREAIVFRSGATFYLHYDGAGDPGWRACLATSPDLVHWTKRGPALQLGEPGTDDSAAACSPWVIRRGKRWHMFYVATANATPPPGRIPGTPYLTRKATAPSPAGPWTKQRTVVPFQAVAGTYYADTASPGEIVRRGDEYLMFFSAAMQTAGGLRRTLGIARTRNLDGAWTVDPSPALPSEEQIENSALYYEKSCATWFLFTNHIGLDARGEYTDAVWVYWSRGLDHWNPARKAVVLDGRNCRWSSACIGMPSVVRVGARLALLYDAPGGESVDHLNRDIGLAWLRLPLKPPAAP